MDFVIAGFGLGSLAVLAGILLADRGAFWRSGRDPESLARSARARGFGRLLAIGGGALIALTVVGLLLPGGDRAGTILVAIGIAALALAVAVWAVGAFGRGTTPAMAGAAPAPPRPKTRRPARPAPAAAPPPPRFQPAAGAPRTAPPRQAQPRRADLPDPDEPDWPDAGDPFAWHDDPLFAPPRPAAANPRPASVPLANAPDPAFLPWLDEPGAEPDAPAGGGDPGDPFLRPRPRTS